MQNSFRWYGPSDPVTLSDIRQSNAEYIVTSLHQIPYGEKWSKNDDGQIKDGKKTTHCFYRYWYS